MAINQYLCDTAEYDMEALENAEENNFAGVDEEFNDSLYSVLARTSESGREYVPVMRGRLSCWLRKPDWNVSW